MKHFEENTEFYRALIGDVSGEFPVAAIPKLVADLLSATPEGAANWLGDYGDPSNDMVAACALAFASGLDGVTILATAIGDGQVRLVDRKRVASEMLRLLITAHLAFPRA